MKKHANRLTDAVARDVGDHSTVGGASSKVGRVPERGDHELRPVSHDDLQVADGGAAWRRGGPGSAETSGTHTGAGAATEAAGAGMDQREGSSSVWLRFRAVDPADCGRTDRAEVRGAGGRDGRR